MSGVNVEEVLARTLAEAAGDGAYDRDAESDLEDRLYWRTLAAALAPVLDQVRAEGAVEHGERVAAAIEAATTPPLSGIGHEAWLWATAAHSQIARTTPAVPARDFRHHHRS